jgi:hypothetical protein
MQDTRGGETYCKECAYSHHNDDPADLLDSVAASSGSATTTTKSKVIERVRKKDLEEAKYTHAGETFCEMLVPCSSLIVLEVEALTTS